MRILRMIFSPMCILHMNEKEKGTPNQVSPFLFIFFKLGWINFLIH